PTLDKTESQRAHEYANEDFNTFNIEFGTANAIKEEPMRIKYEPIDDFTDIKQEEADVYCPSTGASRPFVQINHFSYVEMERMEEKDRS
ncbi:hypothetical protein PENTCL1PPCAC_5598, partial [Pristionchus entomophagus]